MNKPKKVTATKVGRYPLLKIAGETSPGFYESADYLYEFPTGLVWLRTVHDVQNHTHQLALEFIHRGIKFQAWFPPLVVAYSERRLCLAARKFAKENSR